jgi:hypothetical protein
MFISQEKTPKVSSGETEEPFLCGYAGLKQLGLSFEASQPMTLGLSGFGGAQVHLRPLLGLRKTLTPGDVRACVTGFSRSGSVLQGA